MANPARSAFKSAPKPNIPVRWWQRRRARRREIAFAVWDLRERYGAAAGAIARSSALRVVDAERRRFWQEVAAKLRRPIPNRY